jgi:hypothetical protein
MKMNFRKTVKDIDFLDELHIHIGGDPSEVISSFLVDGSPVDYLDQLLDDIELELIRRIKNKGIKS